MVIKIEPCRFWPGLLSSKNSVWVICALFFGFEAPVWSQKIKNALSVCEERFTLTLLSHSLTEEKKTIKK